jgi:dipeptidase
MDAGGDTGDPNAELKGAWERPISIYRCGFSYVCQARGWLPDPIGGLVWFGPDSWWAFNFVANWAGLKYSYMIKDIQQKQNEIEPVLIEDIKEMDKQALALYKEDPKKAQELLTTYCETQANQVVEEWWNFAWTLVARYDDGYVNAPGEMSQEVGYPEDWYDKSEWPNGPTTYKKPKNKQ